MFMSGSGFVPVPEARLRLCLALPSCWRLVSASFLCGSRLRACA